MNFQTSQMFQQLSQPTIAYNPQALNYLRLLMLSQNSSYQNKMNFQKSMPQKSGVWTFNPMSCLSQQNKFSPPKMVMSPSIFDFSSAPISREISSKTTTSPVSHSIFSLSEERRDISESGESLEVPVLSESESLNKEDIPKDEVDRGLMKQSKKIHKQKSSPSQKEKQNNNSNSPKRQKWNEQEDAQLLTLFAQHGPKWTVLASLMIGRTAKQVRDRYTNILRPDIKRDQWTLEEEKLFDVLYAQYGNRWCKIAEHLPGRSENQVKNKFYLHKKREDERKVQSCGGNMVFPTEIKYETKMEYEGRCFGTENISLKIKQEA